LFLTNVLLIEYMENPHFTLHLQQRQRVNQITKHDNIFASEKKIDPKKSVILVVDMWNQHWCKGATERVKLIAVKMNDILIQARSQGFHVIHCPSETMHTYEGREERKSMQNIADYSPPKDINKWVQNKSKDRLFPVGVAHGGCFCKPRCRGGQPWTCQISTIQIEKTDGISDSGREIFNYIKHYHIEQVIIMGVHTNMCILGRPFGIRRWCQLGIPVVLCRDLTDSMYSPRGYPFVSHDRGTELIIEHIERKWCPTILSSDFDAK
jgi:nicotinamidase-related amidase